MRGATTEYGLFLDIQTNQHLMYHRRGIPRYSSGQAIALLKHPGVVRGIGLNPLRPFPDYLAPELLRSPLLTWSTLQSFEKAASPGPMAFYAMSPFELGPSADSMFPSYAMQPQFPIITTLYDLIPLMRPKQYLGRDLAQSYRIRLETLKQADLVLCISGHTHQDALSMLELNPERLVTIGAGVSDYFRPAGPNDRPKEVISSELPNLRKPFIMSVSGAEPRKNTEGLIVAFAKLPAEMRQDLQLAIVCVLNDEYTESWTSIARDNGLAEEDVVLTNLVSDPVLLALYQSAELFVFPSFYEGFGLPAAEAAACGCPTITSSTSSMPEILECPESTFDPSDTDDIASKIHAGLLDDAFRARLKTAAAAAAGKWTWETVAENTIAALDRLPTPTRIRTAPRPPKIALAGPFPPLRSGIADYNLRLAGELARLCELDLLVPVDQLEHDLAGDLPGVRKFPLEGLGQYINPFSYDAIVYVLGNNEHHHSTYEKAIEYPGIVWLHDTQLAGLYISYGRDRWEARNARNFAAYKLQMMYGERTPPELIERAADSIEQYVARGVGMTQEIVAASTGVVVSSRLARDLVKLDIGPWAQIPSIEVIPLAVPSFPQRLHRYQGPPIFGSFGIIGSHKSPDVLLEAFALVHKETDCRLLFVGPLYDEDLRDALQDQSRELGVEHSVTFLGNLTHSDYVSALNVVTCAVQIRKGTHGESSAAIADCLGAGVPVITNLLYCWDLPEGTVDLIPPEPDPGVLSERMRRMIANHQLRDQYGEAGARYAESNTFPDAAAKLVDFCMSFRNRKSPFSIAETTRRGAP